MALLLALMPALVAVAIFVGTFRLGAVTAPTRLLRRSATPTLTTPVPMATRAAARRALQAAESARRTPIPPAQLNA
jgi:hypothetical protein